MSSSFVRRGRRFQQQQQKQHQLEQKTLRVTTEVDDDDDEGRRVRREDAKSDKEEDQKRKIKGEFENEETTKRHGTRPGAHGSRLISTGTEDLDDVLGGGVPLNAVFGIFLDDADDENRGGFGGAEAVANVFANLFLSEGALACEQIGLWLTTDDEDADDERDLRETLPRMMTRRSDSTGEMDGEIKNSKNDGGEGRGGAESVAARSGEDSEKKAESSSGDGLKIAWQYRRYLEKSKEEKEKSGDTRSRGGALNSESKKKKMKLRAFCHDFDVTRAHSNEEAMDIPIDVVQCDVSRNNIGKTFEAVKSFGKKLVEKDSIGRIVIQPPRALLDDPSNAIVFKNYLALLHAVKGFMQRGDMVHRMASFVLFPSKQLLSRTKLSDLRQTCDCYVETSSLLNPEFGFDERATAIESVLPEPTINCIALLSLGKKCFPGALAGGFGTVDSTFAVQRRGKKYAIKPLAQRPEDHDANNEKKTNGSGGLCSSGPTGIGSEGPLDF